MPLKEPSLEKLVKRRKDRTRARARMVRGGGFVAPRRKHGKKTDIKKKFTPACRMALWVGVMTNYDALTGEDELLLVFVVMRC